MDTEEFSVLASMVSAQRIADLERQNEELRKDAAYWRQRCEKSEAMMVASEMQNLLLKNYFMLSLEKIKAFVEKLRSIDRWAFLRTFMQWAMPEELLTKEMPMIDKVMPMPQDKAWVNIEQAGDINVDGNFNDVHDNDKVTF